MHRPEQRLRVLGQCGLLAHPETHGRVRNKREGTARQATKPLPSACSNTTAVWTHWCSYFQTSNHISDLTPSFRSNVEQFVRALHNAGAHVVISATLRPRKRALLMHMAYRVANVFITPQEATERCANGVVVANQSTIVPINWVHNDFQGNYLESASLNAARTMKLNYGLVYQPALSSKHMYGDAIDMTITWTGSLTIVNAFGQTITISTFPRDGAGNTMLHEVGRSYGVIKLVSDRPHWSNNGH